MSELSPTRRRNVARVLSASALNDVADHADIEFGAAGIGGAIRDVAKSLLAPMGHTTRQRAYTDIDRLQGQSRHHWHYLGEIARQMTEALT